MGRSLAKTMTVGVAADVKDFTAAMRMVEREIKYAKKSTVEWSSVLKDLQTVTDKEKLSAEQKAVALNRLSNAMKKYTAEIRTAVAAQNSWLAGMQKMAASRDPFQAGMATMARQNAARQAQREANIAGRLGMQATRQSFLDELDVAAAQANAQLQARRDANFAGRQGRMATRQSFLDELDAINANRQQAFATRQANIAQGGNYMSQFHSNRQQAMAEMREAAKLYKQGAINADQYNKAVTQIRQNHSLAGRAFNELRGTMLTMFGTLVLVTKAVEFFQDSIAKAVELQRNTARLGTFLGSTSDARDMIAEIRQFTREAPVSFEASQRAVTTMLQFGVSSREVIPSLKAIAEITGGDQMRMESLALAFAQSQAAGRLMGQELLQMVNAGFNPLMVISEQTGERLVDLKRRMEDGAISSEMVAEAFRDAVAEGGRFNGLLKEMSDTGAGSITRFNSAMEEMKIILGDGSLALYGKQISNMAYAMRMLTESTGGSGGFSNAQTGWLRFFLLGDLAAPQEANLLQQNRDRASASALFESLGSDNPNAQLRGQRDFVSAMGRSRVGDLAQRFADEAAFLLEYEAFVNQQQTAFQEAFKGSLQSEQQSFISNVYGDRAGIVSLLQSTAGDKGAAINALIDQQAPYEAIFALASETAQEEARRLEMLMLQNQEFSAAEQFRREEEARRKREEQRMADENKRLAEKRQYLRDFIALGEREAKIRQGMADGLTRQQAEQQRNQATLEELVNEADRIKNADNGSVQLARLMAMLQTGMINQQQFDQERNKLLSDATKATMSVSAPSAIMAGSSELTTLLANIQIDAVNEQRQIADRAYKIQKMTAEAATKTADILDEIKDEIAPGMAP